MFVQFGMCGPPLLPHLIAFIPWPCDPSRKTPLEHGRYSSIKATLHTDILVDLGETKRPLVKWTLILSVLFSFKSGADGHCYRIGERLLFPQQDYKLSLQALIKRYAQKPKNQKESSVAAAQRRTPKMVNADKPLSKDAPTSTARPLSPDATPIRPDLLS
jgi:hypothetical protein